MTLQLSEKNNTGTPHGQHITAKVDRGIPANLGIGSVILVKDLLGHFCAAVRQKHDNSVAVSTFPLSSVLIFVKLKYKFKSVDQKINIHPDNFIQTRQCSNAMFFTDNISVFESTCIQKVHLLKLVISRDKHRRHCPPFTHMYITANLFFI